MTGVLIWLIGMILLILQIVLTFIVLVDAIRRPELGGKSRLFWIVLAVITAVGGIFLGFYGLASQIILVAVYFSIKDKDIFI